MYDQFARELEAGIIQEARKDDKLAEPEMAQEEDHAMIQEQTGNGTRFSESQLELRAEQDHAMTREEAGNDDGGDWLLRMMEADVETEAEVKEQGGNMQEEKEGQHHQHATSLELEGFVVADETGDDVAAQDILDTIEVMDIGDINYSVPLSEYEIPLPQL